MRLHTTYYDQIIGSINLGRKESVAGWDGKTMTYDMSHMRLNATCRFISWSNGRVAGLYSIYYMKTFWHFLLSMH